MRTPVVRAGDAGSAAAEFVLVGGLLVLVALSVMQLGLALLVRNTALDAAAEGARYAALAGNTPADGAERTRDLLATALGDPYARHVTAGTETAAGITTAVVTVRAPVPVLGLLGAGTPLEVRGHAVVESVG
ncbi:MAG: TadE/TadG family type IV pilus assembly protein [Microbacteriaceae bacterium]